MTRTSIPRVLAVTLRMEEAWQAVDACFGRFCLTAGIEALHAMMAADVEGLCDRRRSRSTNAIESMQGTIRRVTRNVKRWRDVPMALRWAAAGMLEAKAGIRRLKAYRQLPALRQALAEHQPRRHETPG
jgi:hypothetical protein